MQMNKSELRNVVRSAVKDFIHAHPEALEPKWIESVTKRVTGQIYCHFVHNKNKDNGKITVLSSNMRILKEGEEPVVTHSGSDVEGKESVLAEVEMPLSSNG